MAASEDTLLNASGLPTMYHEDCATSYPNGSTPMCTSSESTVGVPQTFNMSTDVSEPEPPSWSGVLHEQLFGFELSNNASIQFTFRGTDLNGLQLNLTVYFTPDAMINSTDLRPLVLSGTLQNVTRSVSIPGGGFPGGGFSGQFSAHPGGYIFDFRTVRPIGSVYFMARDATAIQQGIKVTISGPSYSWVYLYASSCGSNAGPNDFFASGQKFQVTVTSNTTTDVYLSSPDVPKGAWMEFSPSHLENVGPQGATSTLLLFGIGVGIPPPPQTHIPPPPANPFNDSLFIDASGSVKGLMGEGLIALNNADGNPHILSSPGPVGFSPGAQAAEIGTDQTNYAIGAGVYDPTPGMISNATLSVNFTGVGLIQNDTEVPAPQLAPGLPCQFFARDPG